MAGDSAITTSVLPMDFRNSRMPSRLSAWLAHSGLVMMTLLGFMTTRLLPIASSISLLNGSSAVNARFARSPPEVSETRLIRPPAAAGAGWAAGEASAALAEAARHAGRGARAPRFWRGLHAGGAGGPSRRATNF